MCGICMYISGWCFGTMEFYDFPFSWEESSQLIFNLSEGLRPPTSINMYIYIYCIWFKSTISILTVLMDVFGIYGIVIDK